MPSAQRNGGRRVIGASHQRLIRLLLGSIGGFDLMSPRTLETWMGAGGVLTHARGQPICVSGQASAGLDLLVEGVALAGMGLGRVDECVVSFLRPGELWGTVELFHPEPGCPTDVVAHEDCTVFRVPSSTVRKSMAADPACAHALGRQVAYRVRLLNDRLRDALTLPLSQRLARKIEHLARSFGVPTEEGLEITVRVPQALLSRAVGASRQQVNRELRRLEHRNAIRVARETIIVTAPAVLLREAGEHAGDTLTRDLL